MSKLLSNFFLALLLAMVMFAIPFVFGETSRTTTIKGVPLDIELTSRHKNILKKSVRTDEESEYLKKQQERINKEVMKEIKNREKSIPSLIKYRKIHYPYDDFRNSAFIINAIICLAGILCLTYWGFLRKPIDFMILTAVGVLAFLGGFLVYSEIAVWGFALLLSVIIIKARLLHHQQT